MLRIRKAGIGYASHTVLPNLCLPDILPGQLVAILGPNAVGKSSLLKSIAGLLRYSGDISFLAKPVKAFSQWEKIRHIGYLPQSLPQPTALTPYELILNTLRAVPGRQNKHAQIAETEAIFTALGLASLALAPMNTLSGGQRQMVGLAMVLVRQPELLLLDEPTSALDLNWQLNVLDVVRQQCTLNNTTALVASHDINLALRYCDVVLLLEQGNALGCGAPLSVVTPKNIQSAYSVNARVEQCSRGFPLVLADNITI